ncbi:MAG: hypothetical protein SF028_10490 [Candidatus Sumerlaeia bacterium]|nr:hypothetical protein [Candidatus Sumerlaeia bacterium]
MKRRGVLAVVLALAVVAAAGVALRVTGSRRTPDAPLVLPSEPAAAKGRKLDRGPSEAERIRAAERSARNLANEPYRAPFGLDAADPEGAARLRHAALEAAREAHRGPAGGELAANPALKPYQMPREAKQ